MKRSSHMIKIQNLIMTINRRLVNSDPLVNDFSSQSLNPLQLDKEPVQKVRTKRS
ncbi:hypothetical protein SCEN_D05040 [Saccharomyces cerevisiae]|nr:hypothetical protein SCEN_D05040 [Saccharomyces cerevisiae]